MNVQEGSMQEAINKLKETAQPQEPQEAQSPEEVEALQEKAVEPQDLQTEPEQGAVNETVETETPEVEADDGAERVELEADQFAELLGIKPDLLDINEEGQVRFKAKEGGEVVDVPLEKLINAFQGDANLTNRSKQVAELEKQRHAELANLQNHTQQFAQQTSALLEGLKEQFLKPFDDIDWKELKQEDPGQYAAHMQDKRATEERLAEIAIGALQKINEAQQTQSEELQRQYAEYVGQQEQMLTSSDSKLYVPNLEKVYPEVKSYMSELGFSEQEQGQLADARLLNALYKAMMHDKGKEGAKKKLSKPMPKVLKAGKSPSKQEISLGQAHKLKEKLKSSGSWQDAVAILKSGR